VCSVSEQLPELLAQFAASALAKADRESGKKATSPACPLDGNGEIFLPKMSYVDQTS
jgi:hypothetical protein